jgi:hypothetical protein
MRCQRVAITQLELNEGQAQLTSALRAEGVVSVKGTKLKEASFALAGAACCLQGL